LSNFLAGRISADFAFHDIWRFSHVVAPARRLFFFFLSSFFSWITKFREKAGAADDTRVFLRNVFHVGDLVSFKMISFKVSRRCYQKRRKFAKSFLAKKSFAVFANFVATEFKTLYFSSFFTMSPLSRILCAGVMRQSTESQLSFTSEQNRLIRVTR
jgi:hypothetical protein